MACNCHSYEDRRDHNGLVVTVHEICRVCEPETEEQRITRQRQEAEDYIWSVRNAE